MIWIFWGGFRNMQESQKSLHRFIVCWLLSKFNPRLEYLWHWVRIGQTIYGSWKGIAKHDLPTYIFTLFCISISIPLFSWKAWYSYKLKFKIHFLFSHPHENQTWWCAKPVTYNERPKMKRDTWQKCSLPSSRTLRL